MVQLMFRFTASCLGDALVRALAILVLSPVQIILLSRESPLSSKDSSNRCNQSFGSLPFVCHFVLRMRKEFHLGQFCKQ